MNSFLKTVSLIFVVGLLAIPVLAQRKPKDKILDRKVFVVTMELQVDKERKKEDPFKEELSFRTNKLALKQMRMSGMGGFQMGEYVISEKQELAGEIIYHFQAINKNSKAMSLKWKGRVLGEQIEGKAIVSKKGKVKEEYAFKGELKQK